NIGHLEATIGMAMLMKVVASLQHKTIAPNIYFNEPNEDIAWGKSQVKIPTEAIQLESNGQPLRMAINLSGYSGTNVHMIFEAAEEITPISAEIQGEQLLVFSAKNIESLKASAQKYINQWEEISQNNFTE